MTCHHLFQHLELYVLGHLSIRQKPALLVDSIWLWGEKRFVLLYLKTHSQYYCIHTRSSSFSEASSVGSNMLLASACKSTESGDLGGKQQHLISAMQRPHATSSPTGFPSRFGVTADSATNVKVCWEQVLSRNQPTGRMAASGTAAL